MFNEMTGPRFAQRIAKTIGIRSNRGVDNCDLYIRAPAVRGSVLLRNGGRLIDGGRGEGWVKGDGTAVVERGQVVTAKRSVCHGAVVEALGAIGCQGDADAKRAQGVLVVAQAEGAHALVKIRP